MGVRGRGLGARASGGSEGGFTLVEVVVAGLILVTVLIPSAMLMSNSTTVLTVNQAKLVAANLASGALDEDRALADVAGWSGSTVIAPALPTTAVTSTVNGVAFTVTPHLGWCALTSGSWGDYSTATAGPPAYAVLVVVTWLGSHVLTEGETLTTPTTVVNQGVGNTGGAPSSSSPAPCPLVMSQ